MMEEKSNLQIADLIDFRVGDVPDNDTLFDVAFEIYKKLGGQADDFYDIYTLLLEIRRMVDEQQSNTSEELR